MTALVVILYVTVFGVVIRLASAALRLAVRHPAIVATVVLVIDASDGRPTWASAGAAAVIAVALARRRSRHDGRERVQVQAVDTHDQTLYRFYSSSGVLLYVGISNDAFRRIREHQRAGRITGDWTMMAQRFPDRPSVVAAERHAIRTEHPTQNDVHRVS